jgi:hypothetical protein
MRTCQEQQRQQEAAGAPTRPPGHRVTTGQRLSLSLRLSPTRSPSREHTRSNLQRCSSSAPREERLRLLGEDLTGQGGVPSPISASPLGKVSLSRVSRDGHGPEPDWVQLPAPTVELARDSIAPSRVAPRS